MDPNFRLIVNIINPLFQTVQTSVIKSNLNPVWNEELMLSVPQQYGPVKLVSLLCSFSLLRFPFFLERKEHIRLPPPPQKRRNLGQSLIIFVCWLYEFGL